MHQHHKTSFTIFKIDPDESLKLFGERPIKLAGPEYLCLGQWVHGPLGSQCIHGT